MDRVISRDGTPIAFDRIGTGPPVILVDGALCRREFGPAEPLAKELAPHFTVYTYDRRGRGDSGDTQPYAIEREVEDLAAVILEAGGSACVYGISSGALLALEGGHRGLPIRKLALYEAPMLVDNSRPPMAPAFIPEMRSAIQSGRPGHAVKMFLRQVGLPAVIRLVMPLMPPWKKMKEIAHTLPYDMEIVEPGLQGKAPVAERWSGARMPTLAMDGAKSPAWMRDAMRALASVLPHARHRSLPGQTHMLNPKAIAPVLREFFS
jgi:pimeloyl-ACP methyl ester carboxylesterase